MNRLALVFLPLFVFGCAASKPAPVAAPEKDPWADFKGADSHPIAPVTPPGSGSAELAARLGNGAKANGTDTATTTGAHKKARRAPASVAGKKPRKRAKHFR